MQQVQNSGSGKPSTGTEFFINANGYKLRVEVTSVPEYYGYGDHNLDVTVTRVVSEPESGYREFGEQSAYKVGQRMTVDYTSGYTEKEGYGGGLW